MRAIRDNEIAANAMGKMYKNSICKFLFWVCSDRHCWRDAGYIRWTIYSNKLPATAFYFLIWVMVIIGGSGNNWGAVLGGFVIWFFWIEAEPVGLWLITFLTSGMEPTNWLRLHLIENAAHTRLITMGLVLLLTCVCASRFDSRDKTLSCLLCKRIRG